MDTKALSKIVSIASTLNFLGFEVNHSYSRESVEAFFRLAKEKNIPIFLVDTAIQGASHQEVDGILEEDPYTGQLQQIHPVAYSRFQPSDLSLRITRATNLRPVVEDTFYVDIGSFEVEGTPYHPINDDGEVATVRVPLDNLYLDRTDLITLRDNGALDELAPEPSNKISTYRIDDDRARAFQFWLAGKANARALSNGNEVITDLQTCYEKIGSPIKPQVWAELKAIDPELFSHGEGDFLKGKKLIKFKNGTGTHRRYR